MFSMNLTRHIPIDVRQKLYKRYIYVSNDRKLRRWKERKTKYPDNWMFWLAFDSSYKNNWTIIEITPFVYVMQIAPNVPPHE